MGQKSSPRSVAAHAITQYRWNCWKERKSQFALLGTSKTPFVSPKPSQRPVPRRIPKLLRELSARRKHYLRRSGSATSPVKTSYVTCAMMSMLKHMDLSTPRKLADRQSLKIGFFLAPFGFRSFVLPLHFLQPEVEWEHAELVLSLPHTPTLVCGNEAMDGGAQDHLSGPQGKGHYHGRSDQDLRSFSHEH
jgi:hypothetical protein